MATAPLEGTLGLATDPLGGALGNLLSPSTYINVRRVGARQTMVPKPCAAPPLPLVLVPPPSTSVMLGEALRIVSPPPSPRRRAAGTHLLLRPSCWIKKARTSSS